MFTTLEIVAVNGGRSGGEGVLGSCQYRNEKWEDIDESCRDDFTFYAMDAMQPAWYRTGWVRIHNSAREFLGIDLEPGAEGRGTGHRIWVRGRISPGFCSKLGALTGGHCR